MRTACRVATLRHLEHTGTVVAVKFGIHIVGACDSHGLDPFDHPGLLF